jgi:hypothetical protein
VNSPHRPSPVVIVRLLSYAFAIAFLLAPMSAHAQSERNVTPSNQLGVGINVAGATVQYAFTDMVQAGIFVNFWNTSADPESFSEYRIGPYVRVLFPNVVDPFIDAHVVLSKGTEEIGGYDQTSTLIDIRVGLAYFITPNIGGFASTGILQIGLTDNVNTGFGIGNVVYGGAEWYFSR